MKEPGFWKLNNSHLLNDSFKRIIKMELMHIVHEHQNKDIETND